MYISQQKLVYSYLFRLVGMVLLLGAVSGTILIAISIYYVMVSKSLLLSINIIIYQYTLIIIIVTFIIIIIIIIIIYIYFLGLHSGRIGAQCEAIVKFPKLFEKYPFPILINSALLKLADVFRAG